MQIGIDDGGMKWTLSFENYADRDAALAFLCVLICLASFLSALHDTIADIGLIVLAVGFTIECVLKDGETKAPKKK